MPTLNALKLQFITAFGSIISPYLFSTDDRFWMMSQALSPGHGVARWPWWRSPPGWSCL